MFNHALRDFVGAQPARSTWVRGMARKPRALFVSSAIGLGHVQRDLAIVREIAQLHGGHARLINHADGGALATISLPRHTDN